MSRGRHSRAGPVARVHGVVERLTGDVRVALEGPLLRNAASLYGSTIITSFLGFLYWFVAARMVAASSVGIASAVQSAAQLIAVFCVLGLSTLLISELSNDRTHARTLMLTAATLVGLIAAVVAVVVSVVVHSFSTTVGNGVDGPVETLVFVLLAAFTTMLVVLDDACIGLLRGDLQLKRNTVFAVSKLLLLPLIIVAWSNRSGTELVVAWLAGLVISCATLSVKLAELTRGQPSRLDFRRIIEKRRLMASHHWLNISISAPRLVLPILVVTIVGAAANASYTVAMLVVGFVNIIPTHLATVLFALKPGDEDALRREVRKTMRICLVLAALSGPFFILFSHVILSVFGASYTSASTALAILGLTTYPMAVKVHFVSISRVRGRMAQAGFSTILGAFFEMGLAAFGGARDGLTGVAVGFLAATVIEMAIYGPVVFGVLRASTRPVVPEPAPGDHDRSTGGPRPETTSTTDPDVGRAERPGTDPLPVDLPSAADEQSVSRSRGSLESGPDPGHHAEVDAERSVSEGVPARGEETLPDR